MNLEYYIYILAFVLIIYLLYIIIYANYCGCNLENFETINTTDIYKKIKAQQKSNLCVRNLDANDNKVMKSSNVHTFCKDFPDYTFLNSIITTFLKDHTIINNLATDIVFSTSDIKYGFNPEKNSTQLAGLYKNPDDLASYKIFDGNLMEDDCVALCESNDNCLMSLVGNPDIIPNPKIPSEENPDLNRGYIGRCLNYSRDALVSDDPNIKNENNYKIFLRENTPGYSFSFWIKLTNVSEYKRNILFIGKNRSKIYTSLEIDAYLSTLTLYKLIRSNLENDAVPVQIEPGYEMTTGVWYHIAFTFYGNQVKLFVNGNEEYGQVLNENILVPPNDIPIYIAGDAFDTSNYSKSGYELSKFIWYPIYLEPNVTLEIALNTYPTDDYGMDLASQFDKNPDLIILTNGWKSLNKSIYGNLEITLLDSTLVLLSGSISYGMMNTIVGYIDTSKTPDRELNLLVGGSNGYYNLNITTSGEIYLYDSNYTGITKTDGTDTLKIAEFNKNEIIHLSNIRYVLTQGTEINKGFGNLDGNLYVTTYYNTYIFSGTAVPSFSSGKRSITLGDTYEPIKQTQNLVQKNTENLDKIYPLTVLSGQIKNVTAAFEVNLEGFMYSFLTYTNLSLTQNYVAPDQTNMPGYVMSGNIITLNGLVKAKNRKSFMRKGKAMSTYFDMQSWDSKKNMDTDDSDYNNLLEKCARMSSRKGNLYFDVQKSDNYNFCYSSFKYTFVKPQWSDFQEFAIRYPNMTATNSKLKIGKNSVTKKIYKTFPGLLTVNEDDNIYEMAKATYNTYNFPLEQFYDMLDEFKRVDIPDKYSSDNEYYVALLPETATSFLFDGDINYDYTYLAPKTTETNSLFLTIGNNQDYDETIQKRGIQKYIDFTDSYDNIEDGTYDIRIYTDTTKYFTIYKFSKYDGTFTELYKLNQLKKNLYNLENGSDIIAYLPERYRPVNNSVFTTYTNGGIVNIMITKDGKIINMGLVGTRYLPGANIIDLGNISYERPADEETIVSSIPVSSMVAPDSYFTSQCLS